MKTDELISALAADTLPRLTVRQRAARALPAAAGLSFAAFVLIWGPRDDLARALASGAVLKTLLPLILGAFAGGLALSLAHPGRRPGVSVWLQGFLAAVLLAVFVVLVVQDLPLVGQALATPSLVVCLVSIPVLALPFLGAVFWALSAGAALRPRLTGAAGGLMAGTMSTAVYSLYCTQDAALFVLPAYGMAILFVTFVGLLAGQRWLRW